MVKSSSSKMCILLCLFVMMILCDELVVNVEARKHRIRVDHQLKQHTMMISHPARKGKSKPPPLLVVGTKNEIDAFRPTTPGHSPGVGH
uniref:Uncharacterized protein n=1 Tax=Cannabis sativa TaxID=3483 RepID=A0A803PEY2_CANSA